MARASPGDSRSTGSGGRPSAGAGASPTWPSSAPCSATTSARTAVDVLVAFGPGAHRRLFDLVEMEEDLSGLFGRRAVRRGARRAGAGRGARACACACARRAPCACAGAGARAARRGRGPDARAAAPRQQRAGRGAEPLVSDTVGPACRTASALPPVPCPSPPKQHELNQEQARRRVQVSPGGGELTPHLSCTRGARARGWGVSVVSSFSRSFCRRTSCHCPSWCGFFQPKAHRCRWQHFAV